MIRGAHKPRMVLLKGGLSEEYALSLQNAQEIKPILQASADLDVLEVTITKSGDWLIDGFTRAPEHILQHVDGAYIALHGVYGEDGTVQRIIERSSVPYLGSAPYQSSIGMHKMLTKEQLKTLGIRLPAHMRVSKNGVTDVDAIAHTIDSFFGPEFVIKPMRGGSSIGNRRASGAHGIRSVLTDMFATYDDLIVEEFIVGKSVTAGVIQGFRNQDRYVTPVVEVLIEPGGGDVFSAEKQAPAALTLAAKEEIMQLAAQVHNQLGLKDFSRSDFIVTPNDEVYFLEVNTLPATTKNSPLIVALESVGASQEELVCHLCGNRILGQ